MTMKTTEKRQGRESKKQKMETGKKYRKSRWLRGKMTKMEEISKATE